MRLTPRGGGGGGGGGGAAGPRFPAAGLGGSGLACVGEPSISNMGYITLAQTAVERAAGLPKSGNAEGATVSVSALGGITVHVATAAQGQGHRTVCAQIVADELGVSPADVEVAVAADTSVSPWTVSSGSYSSRFSGVTAGAVQAAARKLAEKIAAVREHLGDPAACPRRVAGRVRGTPEALPPGMGPGLPATPFHAAPNLDPPDAEDRVSSSGAHGFIVDVAVVEIERETGGVRILDYVTVHDAGTLLNPLAAAGQGRGGFARGAGA